MITRALWFVIRLVIFLASLAFLGTVAALVGTVYLIIWLVWPDAVKVRQIRTNYHEGLENIAGMVRPPKWELKTREVL